jgi:hypothetical protein
MLLGLAIAAAVVAGLRSTWSPCSLSMLSAMTPLAERGRGYRFGATTAWFAFGCLAGGATLGLGLAAGAALIGWASLSLTAAAVVIAVVALVCAASDARLGGFHLPTHYRQVDDAWFNSYRRWVYASGFGWQHGVGLVTFIVTSAVYLMIIAAALTGDALAAFAVGVLFGAVRALAFVPARSLTTITAVGALHRRLEDWAGTSRALTIAAQCAIAVVALFGASLPILGLIVIAALAVVLIAQPRGVLRVRKTHL